MLLYPFPTQQHPNEYIRGSTLRFLQKIKEPELLEPLIPTIRACLEHRHSYVRKNAVFCVYAIYTAHEALLVDAPELISIFLAAEADATCRRNAFVMLCYTARERAVEYLEGMWETVGAMEEGMQLALIELIRMECRGENANRVSHQAYGVSAVRADGQKAIFGGRRKNASSAGTERFPSFF